MPARTKRCTSATTHRTSPIELLEPRRMLATFNGTSGNDTIAISVQIGGAATLVQINGGVVQTTTDPTITINAGLGNDLFRVFNTRPNTTILARGEGGNDTLVNPSNLDLDAVYDADFTFDGGSGTDTIVADNGGDTTTPYEIAISGFNIAKFTFNTLLSYAEVESIDYWDSNGSNIIGFFGLDLGSVDIALAIHGNGGNDTIVNRRTDGSPGFGDWDDSVGTGGVVVDGGAGVDALMLANSSGLANTFTFIGNTINGSIGVDSVGLLTYSGCEAIDFVSRDAAEFVKVISKTSSTSLHVNSGGGNDNFTIGNNDFDGSGLLLANTTVIGGAGSDSFTVEDASDTDAAGETENYTWNSTTFAKGAAGFNYSEFENQTLRAANGIIPGLNSVPQVNLNSISSSIGQTVVAGGNARSCFVNVGNGNLGNINGAVFLNLGSGSLDTVKILNATPAGGTQYRLTQTQLAVPKIINYSGAESFTIEAGPGNDTFFIDGSPTGTSVLVNGNNGNDAFTLGAGNLDANLLGSVTVNGGSGVEFVTFNNAQDSSQETQVLNSPTFSDGRTHTFNAVEGLIVNEGPGGVNLLVNKLTVPASINGNTGNDNVTIGGGDLDANLPAGAGNVSFIRGGGGTDSIRFDDLNDTNVDSYFFQRPGGTDQLRKADGASEYLVNWLDVESVTLDASNASSATQHSLISIIGMTTPLRINGNGGGDSFQVTSASAPVTVHTGLGDRDGLFINDATVVIEQSDDIENLVIGSIGTLRITEGAVVAKTRLGLNPGLDISGVLDLAGGALLSRAGGPTTAQFLGQIITGRNGGAWNGAGAGGAVNSSLAASTALRDGVGYGQGSEIGITSLGPFVIESGDTLLRYALEGDATLDGQVNLSDFNRLASNFGAAGRAWVHGDSNYDDTVNLIDFNALAGNFGVAAAPMTSLWQPPNPRASGHDDDAARGWLEQL